MNLFGICLRNNCAELLKTEIALMKASVREIAYLYCTLFLSDQVVILCPLIILSSECYTNVTEYRGHITHYSYVLSIHCFPLLDKFALMKLNLNSYVLKASMDP